MRVLLAEDEPMVRRLVVHHLESWGYEVTTADDGDRAWEIFRRGEFPIVISDWLMPGVDGLELIRRIRAHPGPGYVYVILLTGKSEQSDLVLGMDAGADDFIAKPFDRDELRVRLRAGERVIALERDLARRNAQLQDLNADLRAANHRMKHDLEAAARVQQALLPNAPLDVPGLRSAWCYRPCDELAGDILNVFRLDDRHLGLYVLDVSGHGVASALLSVTVSRLLSPESESTSLVLKHVDGEDDPVPVPPAAVASQLNRQFYWDPATEQYFTLVYGVLDLDLLEFRYVSAGHPGVVHVPRDAPPVILEAPGFPIGVAEEDFEEQSLRLEPGDRLYLYSDGVVEIMNPKDRLFGTAGLLRQLDGARGDSLQGSIAALMQAGEAWRGDARLTDDISILALEIAPDGENGTANGEGYRAP